MGRNGKQTASVFGSHRAKPVVWKNKMTTSGNLNTFWAELIVEELIRNGVDYFCISPGSRSTPLVAAAAANKNAKKIVCIDERSSGYHAVGYARATGKPAVVITTSGTAAANLLPAVTEASRDHLPLIMLTADRPEELVKAGANQTIDQRGLFGKFVLSDHDLECPDTWLPPELILETVDYAVLNAVGQGGPVHINCRYDKPLEPCKVEIEERYTKGIAAWQSSNEIYTKKDTSFICEGIDQITPLAEIINKTDRGMIVIGKLTSNTQRQALRKLIEKINWPVYADITSGMRLGDRATGTIRYYDQELLNEKFNELAKPDTVLHFGRRITSKRVPEFFDANRPADYVVINSSPCGYTPTDAVTMTIEDDVASVCGKLIELVNAPPSGEYAKFLNTKGKLADAIIKENVVAQEKLTEVFTASEISANLPEGSCLFLSNSMPVRDMDLYCSPGAKDVVCAANRGVSGIDGIVSTACGMAAGSNRLTTVIVGDMAFMYDINALALARAIDVPVIIVLINNHGGGIFDFLPIAEHADICGKYFTAEHDFDFKGVCETFKIRYYKAQTKSDLSKSYGDALKKGQPALIEVFTDRAVNLKLRKKIKKQILNMLQDTNGVSFVRDENS
jgi:2-succinyl-5-enolpyruvyl-6-hydroxy-3-cyclohexene-1-carboxylate synthase